jgi:hypothetical protein
MTQFSCLNWFFKQLIDFSAITPLYITYPKEIPNFHALEQLIISYPQEIPNFHTINRFLQLNDFSVNISPIQPIFHTLILFSIQT